MEAEDLTAQPAVPHTDMADPEIQAAFPATAVQVNTDTMQREVINVDAPDAAAAEQAALPPTQAQQVKIKPASVQDNERRQRRRMIRRMRHSMTPSFVALVSPKSAQRPKRIRIDVDEYLGLKRKRKSSTLPAAESQDASTASVPAEEGWYEGVVKMALPGEEGHLPEMQVLIRSNLELFSATDADAQRSQAGRRTPTVRGKVGVRCIHCAEAVRKNPSLPWPAGAVSYPINIVGLYPVCTQKPQLHFQSCPYMPLHIKERMHSLMFDETGAPRRQRKVATSATSDGDATRSVSSVMYYTIAAKMVGLENVPGGMRFGRDLALEPLPLETVRAQIEATQTPHKRSGGSVQIKPDPARSSEPRITADVESERVLAQAVAEKDDDKLLARSADKESVTDFVFLCCKQMAICHAVPADFSTRGKKTKMMRVGFAGFCCRHCSKFSSDDDILLLSADYSCRSFASAADNLASAISNSFYMHIQKCPSIPAPVLHALAAYKRIHSKQMSRLPHGSQRRLFHILWSRLRAADVSEEEMMEKLKNLPASPQNVPSSPFASTATESTSVPGSASAPVPDQVASTAYVESEETGQRGPRPVCSDEETILVLKKAEESQDSTVNDNLLLPSDRHLISDFVFLMMNQLKAAHPSLIDFTRGKRSTVVNTSQAGLQCIHCAGQSQNHFFGAVGRSFPSAPDNMASSLNSSLYHHLQKCPFAPGETKRALANLKKIHSAQCSSIRFGSQRRFFNMVFDRLRKIKVENAPFVGKSGKMRTTSRGPNEEAEDDVLRECGFLEVGNNCYECQHCRMVPFSLRAENSIAFGRPSNKTAWMHKNSCARDSFDLGNAVVALEAAVQKCVASSAEELMHSPRFAKVVREAVGRNEDLTRVFTGGIAQYMLNGRASSGSSREISEEWRGLWNKFPASVDADAVSGAFKEFADTVPDWGLNPDLFEEPLFLRFLQIISPVFMHTSKPSVQLTNAKTDEPRASTQSEEVSGEKGEGGDQMGNHVESS